MRTLKRLFLSLATLVLMGQMVAARAAQLPEFTDLVEQVSPAVVNISTRQHINPIARGNPHGLPDLEGLPPLFREFLERSIPQQQAPQERGQQRQAQSLGSGFIISADGYVLTNNHVIADADEIIVRLSDRSELAAKLVGADPRTDVALLKVNGQNLPTVELGKSDKLKVGEWVVAIGSPFGFDHSVTAGIVSAKGRSLPNENYVPFIQTDVAINPGNSGGPLFNLKGEVVGINSQIFTRSGGFMGLSFAIPIDVAMNVAEQVKANGKVNRGWLGVAIQEVNKELAESFGLDRPVGALLSQVIDGGPAARGGLQVGDVILSVNGQPVQVSADLPHLVGNLKPGTQVALELMRSGKRRTVEIAIGSMPENNEQASATGTVSTNRLGVTVTDLSDNQRQTLDVESGVIVQEVANGPAAVIGLRAGDVITHLNNQAINSASLFERAVEALPKNRSVSMRVLRQGRASFITFKLAE